MARPGTGYVGITIDPIVAQHLDSIAEKELCATRAEVVRRLVRMYDQNATNNGLCEILSPELWVTV